MSDRETEIQALRDARQNGIVVAQYKRWLPWEDGINTVAGVVSSLQADEARLSAEQRAILRRRAQTHAIP